MPFSQDGGKALLNTKWGGAHASGKRSAEASPISPLHASPHHLKPSPALCIKYKSRNKITPQFCYHKISSIPKVGRATQSHPEPAEDLPEPAGENKEKEKCHHIQLFPPNTSAMLNQATTFFLSRAQEENSRKSSRLRIPSLRRRFLHSWGLTATSRAGLAFLVGGFSSALSLFGFEHFGRTFCASSGVTRCV